MPNISSYGSTASGKRYTGKKGGMSQTKRKTAGSSAQATMRRQQADLEKRRAQREASNNKPNVRGGMSRSTMVSKPKRK